MKNERYGRKKWAFSGGIIPLQSTGHEPEFVGKDTLAILNTTGNCAQVTITIYHSEQEPVGKYKVEVQARRIRKINVNDLIDPQAVPLGVAYGAVLESSEPIIVQFTRQDTGQAALAIMGSMAFPVVTTSK